MKVNNEVFRAGTFQVDCTLSINELQKDWCGNIEVSR